jgi:hypothetical protein
MSVATKNFLWTSTPQQMGYTVFKKIASSLKYREEKALTEPPHFNESLKQ